MNPTRTARFEAARARVEAFSDEELPERARSIVAGKEEDAEFCVALGLRLRDAREYNLGRRVLERVSPGHPHYSPHLYRETGADVRPGLEILAQQQRAFCTYMNEDEPANRRFDEALAILGGIAGYGRTEDEIQETLGLFGAVYKRRWELDAQKENLERSLRYYRLGASRGVGHKQGYTAINAAYVLELLAYHEEAARRGDRLLASNGCAPAAAAYRAEADELRREVAAEIARQLFAARAARQAGGGQPDEPDRSDWWYIMTVAEAHFGLRDYEAARTWLGAAVHLHNRLKETTGRGIDGWMWKSPLRQFAALARLQAGPGPEPDKGVMENAGRVLGEFMRHKFAARDTDAVVRSALMGKIGLGLSGGGFRASLFHIGVLAKMAELDLLRRVEVLSCVSGGSIIGAHYYLEVRHLLQTKTDEEITREDYVDIVRRVERDFLAGVQRNIRTRILAEWWTNVKLAFTPSYTRTNRVGELYERELFARVGDGEVAGAKGRTAPRWLNKLRITPKEADAAAGRGEKRKFHPRHDNWRRAAKVPILVLNATTLNTGHNWQFTATWMGEPPSQTEANVDASDWLRRMYYTQAAPAGHGSVRLGDAVAASSCVPGLFEPLLIEKLYVRKTAGGAETGTPNAGEEFVTVRLVDGGAHDNQGITALLDQDCSVILVSDASGQMASVKDVEAGLAGSVLGQAVGGALSVLLRTQDVLMARIREAEYLDLAERQRQGQLGGLMYIHLTHDLRGDPVSWRFCDDPLSNFDNDPRTNYGVRKEVQRLLATVRTDLDSFTDAEAYALMTSGYRMAGQDPELQRLAGIYQAAGGGAREVNWKFLAVESWMNDVSGDLKSPYQMLLRQLAVAANVPFKVWRLLRWLQVVAAGLALFVLAAAVLGVWYVLTTPEASNAPVATYGGIIRATLAMIAAALVGLVIGKTAMSVLNYRKTLRRVLVHLGMTIFGFALARLHLSFFDRLYLGLGRIREKPHVFFCYAGADEQYASAVDDALRRSGYVTALDGKETLFNEASAAETERLIEDSDTVLFIESEMSVASKVCGRWLKYATGKGKDVVRLPARRGGPFVFGAKEEADAAGGPPRLDGKALRSLLADLGAGGGPPHGGNGGGAPVEAARAEAAGGAARVSRGETEGSRAG